MSNGIQELIVDVLAARERFIAIIAPVSHEQAHFRPDAGSWSITDNAEHMTLAERTGIVGMWKALDGIRRGVPIWTGAVVHRGRHIKEIIRLTWQEREVVPPVAAPGWGGPISYWVSALRSGQLPLESLARELETAQKDGFDLATIICPHPISGPLDVWQRLEFLRFHLDRHGEQVQALLRHPHYPVINPAWRASGRTVIAQTQ